MWLHKDLHTNHTVGFFYRTLDLTKKGGALIKTVKNLIRILDVGGGASIRNTFNFTIGFFLFHLLRHAPKKDKDMIFFYM